MEKKNNNKKEEDEDFNLSTCFNKAFTRDNAYQQ
jgi:hypothetical protein